MRTYTPVKHIKPLRRDYAEIKRAIEVLLPLGLGRPGMTETLRQLGFDIGPRKTRELILELRAERVRELPKLLGERAQGLGLEVEPAAEVELEVVRAVEPQRHGSR